MERSYAVFTSYLKITWRNLRRYKAYSFINIIGLSIGLGSFILIFLWVRGELSYDQFHENKDRIYRVNSRDDTQDRIFTNSSWALAPAMKLKYAEIESYTRIWPWNKSVVTYGGKSFMEERFFLSDPEIFTMFSFRFLRGDPSSALADRNSIVITEETAKRYFGDEDPMGKVVHVSRQDADLVVSGVVETIPPHSHLRFDMVARIEWMGPRRMESWELTGPTYIMLHPGVSEAAMNSKIKGLYKELFGNEVTPYPVLQPLTQIHLYEHGRPGLVRQIYMFSIIALFVLIIACINFMNLTTAKSVQRAKEVGVRKVSGAARSQLVVQFLGETIALSLLALLFAAALIELVLPAFNAFAGGSIHLVEDAGVPLWASLTGIVLLTGLLAGFYPALVLSSFSPVEALKDARTRGSTGSFLRKVLIVLQFSISTGLMICTLVVYDQLQYVENKDLGLDPGSVVMVPVLGQTELLSRFEPLEAALAGNPDVLSVTGSMNRPTETGTRTTIRLAGSADNELLPILYTTVDFDYFKTFGMDVLQGRTFSRAIATDSTEACVVNESAVKALGLASPIGTVIYFNHSAFDENRRQLRIIGVVKDFHAQSMHKAIEPFVFRIHRPWHSYLFIKIRPDNIGTTLQTIKKTFAQFAPHYPFQYQFVKESIERQYQPEQQTGRLFGVFSGLAVLISCLGLLGLAAHTAERKTREIGIRKVFGASIARIVGLLSKEFSKGILLANLIAWPVAYVVMTAWLQSFAYRVGLSWWMFAGPSMLAIVIAAMTVGTQAWKASRANPVDSLRYE